MINRKRLLNSLEQERKFAIKNNFPLVALGIQQSINIVKNQEEKQAAGKHRLTIKSYDEVLYKTDVTKEEFEDIVNNY